MAERTLVPQNPPERCILLVDADAFFVAVARMVDPEGAGKADLLIVGGRPGARGVVSSASYAARKRGVRSGMATSRALELCPEAMVVPVPFKDCRRVSRSIAEVLREYVPIVESASIDEWYCDATGVAGTATTAERRAFAESIRTAVLDCTGASVSIGVSTACMVSKIAVELCKPGGVHVVPAGHEALFMRYFDLTDIPGIGPRFNAELRSRGLIRVSDVLPLPRDLLIRWLGDARGAWLYDRVRGIDPSEVEPHGEPKSVSREQTFDTDLRSLDDIDRELVKIVDDVTDSLRDTGYRARTVTVKVRDWQFRDRSAGRSLAAPVESARPVLQVARELLTYIRETHRAPVRLLGVTLSNLVAPGEGEQIPLFEEEPLDTERDRRLAGLRDQLRERFGDDAVGVRQGAPSGENESGQE